LWKETDYKDAIDIDWQSYIAVSKISHSGDHEVPILEVQNNRDEALRDAFISGPYSNTLRQRLLEHKSMDFKTTYAHANPLPPELEQKQSVSFLPNNQLPCATVSNDPPKSPRPQASSYEQTTAASMASSFFFCGYALHPRYKCPAKDATCKMCEKKGDFQKLYDFIQVRITSTREHRCVVVMRRQQATVNRAEKINHGYPPCKPYGGGNFT
ncbi:hypothetical protein CLF_106501, partial [Clonorchis sinensis]